MKIIVDGETFNVHGKDVLLIEAEDAGRYTTLLFDRSEVFYWSGKG